MWVIVVNCIGGSGVVGYLVGVVVKFDGYMLMMMIVELSMMYWMGIFNFIYKDFYLFV